MKNTKIWTLLALVAVALTMHATARAADYVTTYTSDAGETLDAFALRIAPDARKLSNKEVCGEFWKEGSVYKIEMYTIGRELECSYDRTKSGREYTGLTFHTHVLTPRDVVPRFTEADYAAHPGYMTTGKIVMFQTGKGTARKVSNR